MPNARLKGSAYVGGHIKAVIAEIAERKQRYDEWAGKPQGPSVRRGLKQEARKLVRKAERININGKYSVDNLELIADMRRGVEAWD